MLSVILPMDSDFLPQPQRLALLYAPPAMRPVFGCLLALDQRLGRIVASAREPMLAQMRLAWWRDRLGESREQRPRGDPLLDAIAVHWHKEEAALVALVDGWEELLGNAPLGEAAFVHFARGRGTGFAAVARLCGKAGQADKARSAGCRYALGDCLARLSDPIERERVQSVAARGSSEARALPRTLRPLAILGALGERVIRRGKGPLFGDRGSALLAIRLGILGR